jgi:hypothetical protein
VPLPTARTAGGRRECQHAGQILDTAVAWVVSAQHGDLVTRDQDLDVPCGVGACEQCQPAQHAGEHQVRYAYRRPRAARAAHGEREVRRLTADRAGRRACQGSRHSHGQFATSFDAVLASAGIDTVKIPPRWDRSVGHHLPRPGGAGRFVYRHGRDG